MKKYGDYWNDEGKYDKELKSLTEELMPLQGDGETVKAELVRIANRLMYEYCNNGNCNACEVDYHEETTTCHYCSGRGFFEYGDEMEDCSECDGMGEIEEEYEGPSFISPYYQRMLDFLQEFTKVDTRGVEDVITANLYGMGGEQFSDRNMDIYNKLIDDIMEEVLNDKDGKFDIPNPHFEKD